MPSTEQRQQRLGEMYRALQVKSVRPGDALYVKIWEGLPYDPVARLRKHIEFSEVESLQLFSGFSGAGKTTQLLRLQQELTGDGYLVIYADAEDYLNLGEPVEIADLLYTVAGAFSDGLEKAGVDLPKGESYWKRFQHYLTKTQVEIPELSIPAGPVELKAELKTSATFRQKLQQHLGGQLRELVRQTREFIEEGVKEVYKKLGSDKRVVFILDSLEKLRATPSNEQELMDRLEKLFRNHLQTLKFPWLHCVYSVPAWLRYVITDGEIVLIPSIKQYEGRASTTPSERGWSVLRELVERRLHKEGCRLLFGEPDSEQHFALADRLIQMSGGAPRDLLRLFREVLLVAAAEELPVSSSLVESAISSVRNELKVAIDDAHWLAQIAKSKAADLTSCDKREINRLMRLLDNHFILCFRNDSDWYDIHPLIREEVERIVASNPAPAAQ